MIKHKGQLSREEWSNLTYEGRINLKFWTLIIEYKECLRCEMFHAML